MITEEEGGKRKHHIQPDELSAILNRQMDEIDMWHAYRLDEHPELEVTRYDKSKREQIEFPKLLESEKKALAEMAKFVFAYAVKTPKGIKIGEKEYTHEELEKYRGLMDFAKIEPKKAKDVRKEVDAVMYG